MFIKLEKVIMSEAKHAEIKTTLRESHFMITLFPWRLILTMRADSKQGRRGD